MKNFHTFAALALAGSTLFLSSCGSEKLAVKKVSFLSAQVTPETNELLSLTVREPLPAVTQESQNGSAYVEIPGARETKNEVPATAHTRIFKPAHILTTVSPSAALSYQKAPLKKPFKQLKAHVEGPATNGFAIAGFVVSLVGLFILGIPLGILAIVFSGIAMAKISKHRDTQKGMGLAIAGLVIGIVDIIGAIIFASMVL